MLNPNSGGPKALFLGRGVYDYLEATIVEGLKKNGVEVVGIHLANYIEDIQELPCDGSKLSLVFCNKENLVKLSSIRGYRPTPIFVDGRDDPFINPAGLSLARIYLKRELLRFPLIPRKVTQTSFGVEERYIPKEGVIPWEKRGIDVFLAMSPFTNESRRIYLKFLEHLCEELGISKFSGSTGERAYNNKAGGPLPTPIYHHGLLNSKIAVSLFGAGQDCARFWEILASGALLVSEKPTLASKDMPIHGVHCFYFEGMSELDALIRWIASEPASAKRIAEAGHVWALEFRRPETIMRRALSDIEAASTRNSVLGKVFLYVWCVSYNTFARIYLVWFRRIRPNFLRWF